MLSEPARAKINLCLHVVGRRADGFHEIESLIAFARNISDTLIAEEADAVTLTLEGPFAAALEGDESNLVLRAARALQSALGVKKGAALRLTKNLPVASGIGGGSADAAATLRLLAKLWQVEEAELVAAVAASLGSDVPACFQGQTAWATGIGQELRPVTLPAALHLLLVNPGIALPTAMVYEVFRRMELPFRAAQAAPYWDSGKALLGWLHQTANDLDPAALVLAPEIAAVQQTLSAQPGCELVRMSGSGATCFGVFFAREDAEGAARNINAQYPQWWVKYTQTI